MASGGSASVAGGGGGREWREDTSTPLLPSITKSRSFSHGLQTVSGQKLGGVLFFNFPSLCVV